MGGLLALALGRLAMRWVLKGLGDTAFRTILSVLLAYLVAVLAFAFCDDEGGAALLLMMAGYAFPAAIILAVDLSALRTRHAPLAPA